jgi:hypothetical protein
MSVRRTVIRRNGHFQVSDDPDDVFGYLLGCLASEAVAAEAPATRRFAPDGPGLSLLDTLLAIRPEPIDLADLPPQQVPAELEREWWMVSLERPHGESGPPAVVFIEGDELRDLLRQAGLWST